MLVLLYISETWGPKWEKWLRLRKREEGHDYPGMTVGEKAARSVF